MVSAAPLAVLVLAYASPPPRTQTRLAPRHVAAPVLANMHPVLPSRSFAKMHLKAVAVKPARTQATVARRVVRLALVAASLAALSQSSPAWAGSAVAEEGAKLHVGQKLALWLQSFGLPNELILVLISTLPVIELRGAVPVASWLGVGPLKAFVVCVLGNTAAVVVLLAALRLSFVERILKPLLDKARSKIGTLADDGSLALGLALFVGIPLPGTGGWTGAMIAHLLNMPFPLAVLSIFSGVALAGIIMTVLTLAGWYGAAIAIAALTIFVGGALFQRNK
eukprot:CAMPEP_0206046186 /NCGR_PEP_ID=MMETSP1466-20131121/17935_1 /ASSEMBLY_ACC=CAM_ASM_001126 /TAXON_ID=44452 /ORGANISM="Pavlova gyrans, Strain CCMP608" /LENGTH=279 /DNA_ID=CAMNT_0053421157 /DNA_START=52 /DNA_END=891 /DNA_ORIENTATION=+